VINGYSRRPSGRIPNTNQHRQNSQHLAWGAVLENHLNFHGVKRTSCCGHFNQAGGISATTIALFLKTEKSVAYTTITHE
jgi:hypothetical protein